MERHKVLDELKIHLRNAQQQMKLVANKHRREVEYMVRDQIYVKMRTYRRKSLVLRHNEKLAPRYHQPFEVLAMVERCLIGCHY